MNALLKERLQEIIRICALIIEEDHALEIERERSADQKIIPFNPLLWNIPGAVKQKCAEKAAEDNLNFTEKEFRLMPRFFRTEFRRGHLKARIHRRSDGRYEIRCQINHIPIYASGMLLSDAKQRFIERLKFAFGQKKEDVKKPVVVFGEYIKRWAETVKRPYIKPTTYRFYMQLITSEILPRFGKRDISTIKSFELQAFMNELAAGEKFRTCHKMKMVLSAVFDYAVADEVLNRSPMQKVVVVSYEENHGVALTRQEEKQLIDALYEKPESINRQAFVFLVYTGLRRSELMTAELDGDWIHVTTGKQRLGKKPKKRSIPVSPMLKKVLNLIYVDQIKAIAPNTLTGKFKILMPNHHLHELRHTFITRCQECGVPREIVSLWAGHAADSSITTLVYTHLEQAKQRQLDEIAKVIYDFES